MSVLTDGDIDLIAKDGGIVPTTPANRIIMFKPDLMAFARAIEEACQPQWRPVSDPPQMIEDEIGWLTSKKVLVWPLMEAARLTQSDEEYPPMWRTGRSGWDITNVVTHWMPLPEGPTP